MEMFLDWDNIEDYSHLVPDKPQVVSSYVAVPEEMYGPAVGPVIYVSSGVGPAPGMGVISINSPSSIPWYFRLHPELHSLWLNRKIPSYEEYEYEQYKLDRIGRWDDETIPVDYGPMS